MPCHGTNGCNQTKNGNGNYMRNKGANGRTAPNMQTRNITPMRNGMQMPQGSNTGQQQRLQTPTNGSVTTATPIPPIGDTPSTVQNPYYTAGFLRQFIGQNMRVEYLIGTNGPLVDRIGTLVDVGADYIVLKPYLSDDLLMTDLYSIKFVTIYDQLT